MQPIDIDIRDKILKQDGNIVICASAGTGKTYTIIEKINYEIKRDHKFRIFAAITFTKKAAKEIESRLAQPKSEGFVGTNDGFILNEVILPFMYDVYGYEFKKELKPDYSIENQFSRYEHGINKIRDTGFICKYSDNRKNFTFELGLNILLNSEAARLYFESKYYRFFIDEYQDSDKDMHKFFMYICNTLGIPLFIVGDIKQSIYGWRGGYVDGFINIINDSKFCKFVLKHNFRSTQSIQNYANMFMDDTRGDFIKVPFDKGVSCFAYKAMQHGLIRISEWVDTNKKTAFLIRRNDDAKNWAVKLNDIGLDFTFIPSSPLDNSELESEHVWIARDIAYYILCELYSEFDFYDDIPNSDAYNFSKIKALLHKIEMSISDQDAFIDNCYLLYHIMGYEHNNRMTNEVEVLYEVIRDDQYLPTYNSNSYDHVVSTIHAAKGLQYKQVVILAENYNLNNEEDRNLHYVAVTRPEERLLVLCNCANMNGKMYCKQIDENISKVKNMGIDIVRSDVAECTNSGE